MLPLMNLSDSQNWPTGKETFNSTIFIETNGLVLGGVVLTIALIIAILIVQRKK
jgi:preprotein translocase subunit SecE